MTHTDIAETGRVGHVPWDAERLARAALTWVSYCGGAEFQHLIASYGAQDVWASICRPDASAYSRRAARCDPAQMQALARAKGVRPVIPSDPEWPTQLDDLAPVEVGGVGGVPAAIWVRGPANLRDAVECSVAIVGSRACTSYGENVATDLAFDLSKKSREGRAWTIVSGGAYGIDAASHRGALAAGGASVAVLAGGPDDLYPKGNARLLEELSHNWLIVSEQPPGRHPTRQAFLSRNRLIAALTCGTIVVEAAMRSGARNTAAWAAALGRTVMAVPGPVTSAASVTPHRLIRDGEATLVTSAADVCALLEPVGTGPELPVSGPQRRHDAIPERMRPVFEAIPGRGSVTASELSLSTGVSIVECLAALAQLSDLGFTEQTPSGAWRLASR